MVNIFRGKVQPEIQPAGNDPGLHAVGVGCQEAINQQGVMPPLGT